MSRPFTVTAVCISASHKYQGCAGRNFSTDNNLFLYLDEKKKIHKQSCDLMDMKGLAVMNIDAYRLNTTPN